MNNEAIGSEHKITQVVPLLVQKFDQLRASDLLAKDLVGEENKSVVFDTQDIDETVAEAFHAWEYIFDKSSFEEAVANLTGENKKYLKKIRKFGLILKSVYQFFSQQHSAPEAFHIFLHALGEYNDLIEANQAFSPQGREIAKKLTDFSQVIEEGNSLNHDTFYRCEKSSFLAYVHEAIQEIFVLLEKSPLVTEEFHRLRKRLRLFMNLFQVIAAKQIGGDAHRQFLELYEFSTTLGEEHDEVVQKGLSGEQEYHTQTFVIAPAQKEHITHILEKVSRSVGLNRVAV